MSKFDIEEYFNSFPDDTKYINVSGKNYTFIPELTRFKYLEVLCCNNNELTRLPDLPKSLIKLDCSENKLTSLPQLPTRITMF